MLWLIAGLFAGFAPPNVIRWHWWRFNGYGYFSGMLSGILMAIIYPRLFPDLSAIDAFPFIFFGSTLIAIITSLLTKPTDEKVLIDFYRSVKPWGFWGPIKEKVIAQDQNFEKPDSILLTITSLAVGIVWQVSIASIPVYAVLQMWRAFAIAITVFVVCSLILKVTWYDRLEKW
jgi:hypothetical protein